MKFPGGNPTTFVVRTFKDSQTLSCNSDRHISDFSQQAHRDRSTGGCHL